MGQDILPLNDMSYCDLLMNGVDKAGQDVVVNASQINETDDPTDTLEPY